MESKWTMSVAQTWGRFGQWKRMMPCPPLNLETTNYLLSTRRMSPRNDRRNQFCYRMGQCRSETADERRSGYETKSVRIENLGEAWFVNELIHAQ